MSNVVITLAARAPSPTLLNLFRSRDDLDCPPLVIVDIRCGRV